MPETELTQDEYTVLLIASSGESMMPIGRWEKPVEALVERGFLQRHNKFNNTITETGKKAIAAREQEDDSALINAVNNLAQAGSLTNVVHESLLDTAAKAIFAYALQTSNPQESKELGLRRASEEVLKRALEFL